MAIPITKSDTPLVADALPALKVRHYYGQNTGKNIYTFARFYFLQGGMDVTLNIFEKDPDKYTCAKFAISGLNHKMLLLEVNPQEAKLSLWEKGMSTMLPAPKPNFFAGEDEQGWYWGAGIIINKEILAELGVPIHNGREFGAALLKTRQDETGFGSSFLVKQVENPLNEEDFGRFVAVDY